MAKLYSQRVELAKKFMAVEELNRIPFYPSIQTWGIWYGGSTTEEVLGHPKKELEAYGKLLRDMPAAGEDSSGPKTRMILCTVKDDLHDIGKNIVRAMLEANGFDVLDLGIDVPAATVVDEVKKNNIKIVALSGVLTLAIDSMKNTVDALKAEGLDVKVIIGGAPVSADACKIVGADEWAHSPQKTVATCKAWANS